MAKKKWADLSARQRRMVYLAATAEAVVTSAALSDLAHRPASAVRGPKAAWAVACFVQPIGPPAYFLVGRSR